MGVELGPYELLRRLGAARGDGRESYLAVDLRTGAPAVVKLVRGSSSPHLAWIRHRVEQVRAVSSPHLVGVHEAIEVPEGVLIASVSLPGEDLLTRMRQGEHVSLRAAFLIGEQVLRGLSSLHRAGLLHLDVKPSNVVVTFADDGSPHAWLIDLVPESPRPEYTLDYASPVLLRDEPPDTGCDLYSVGATLFELITGRVPHPHDTVEEVRAGHLAGAPGAEPLLAAGLPRAAAAMIVDLMSVADRPLPMENFSAGHLGGMEIGFGSGPSAASCAEWFQAAARLVSDEAVKRPARPARPPLAGDTVSAGEGFGAPLGPPLAPDSAPPPSKFAPPPSAPRPPESAPPPAPPSAPRPPESAPPPAPGSAPPPDFGAPPPDFGAPPPDFGAPPPLQPAPPSWPMEPASPAPASRPRFPLRRRRERSAPPALPPQPRPPPEIWKSPAQLAAEAAATAQPSTSDSVDCTVFAPPNAFPGTTVLVQAFLHTPGQAEEAAALATEFDLSAKRRSFRGLELPLAAGAKVEIELTVRGAQVHDPVQRLVWRQRAEAVQFDVDVPVQSDSTSLAGTTIVRLDGMPIGRVGFRIEVSRDATVIPAVPHTENQRRFQRAFVSYASPDRTEVLKRVQGLRSAHIDCFQDVLNLEPGERWEKQLYRHIDEADLFLLFWSKAAKSSDWVRREVDYALGRQNGDPDAEPEIRPVVIEGPPVELPWPDLGHLHFFDPLVYLLE